jgi:hypothetical protein
MTAATILDLDSKFLPKTISEVANVGFYARKTEFCVHYRWGSVRYW